jgi:hypothetical protein
MLNYFREAQEARFATAARRSYGYASAGVVVAIMALVVAGRAPAGIFWAAFAVSLGLDALLTRKWIRDDALRAHQTSQAGNAGQPPVLQ